MSGAEGNDKKQVYFQRLTGLLEEYTKIFIVEVDNVGSNHLQKVRSALRGQAVILMGKNTMVRKVLRAQLAANPSLEVLLPLVRGNVGFVFVKDDLSSVRTVLLREKVGAPAKAGTIAPCNVTIPSGNTGMEPSMNSFFQALNIATKINKGQIEITKDFKVCTAGKKVGNSEAVLLQKLNIKPFTYGMEIHRVYDDGTVLTPEIFNMNPADLIGKFKSISDKVAAISLAINRPNQLSTPHFVVNAFKNVASIALASGLKFKLLNSLSSAGPAPSNTGAKPAEKKEEKKEEKAAPKEDEAPMDMGGMFDDF